MNCLASREPAERILARATGALRLLGCAAALAWAAAAAAASEGASTTETLPAARPPNVAEILARNAEARGGLAAWQALKTLSEKGHIEHGQIKAPKSRHGTPTGARGALEETVPFILQLKRPHRMRLEMTLGDITALQLFDGVNGWTVQPSPKGPMLRQFSPAEAAAAAEQIDPEGPLLDAAAKGTTVRLDGEDLVEGHRAYKLALTLKDGNERHVWIDAKSFLDLKIDGTRLIEGRPWPAETYFYDWKTSAGLRIPRRIETAINDVRSSARIIVERVLVDAPVADELFRLPGPLPAPAPAPGPAPTPAPVPAPGPASAVPAPPGAPAAPAPDQPEPGAK